MHVTRTMLLLILLITICQVFRSCESGHYKGTAEFESVWVKVDSIHIPSEIKSTIPFAIEFFGTLGNNGCYHSGANIRTSSSNDIILKIYGNFYLQAKNCTSMMDYRTVMAIAPAGIYNLKIKQPDNTYLVRQITVN